jgi:hypothetical protein
MGAAHKGVTMPDKPKITLGTIEVTTPKTQVTRMSMVIWGPSGCGKTTIAATAPRPILWINFDPDGTSSLMDQEDIHIADFSMENPNKVVTFKHENAGGIKQVLDDHPDIKTVVFDSIRWHLNMQYQKYVELVWNYPRCRAMADVTVIQCKELCQSLEQLEHSINIASLSLTKTHHPKMR